MALKVKAFFPEGKIGFFGTTRKRDGDVFEIDSLKQFSDRWMEPVGWDVEVERRKQSKPEK